MKWGNRMKAEILAWISDRLLLRLRLLVIALACCVAPAWGAPGETIRVGLYQAPPNMFTDESGRPAGLYVDILNHVAERESWHLEYVPGSWAELLGWLEKGEIDLVANMSFTAEREKTYSFNKETIDVSWSTAYVAKGSGIVSLLDLRGKRVAILPRSIQESGFLRYSHGFDLGIKLIPGQTIEEGFEMVGRGEADAVITDNIIGAVLRKKYGFDKTAIFYDALASRIVATKGDPKGLLAPIDLHLAAMKSDPSSVYSAALNRWQPNENGFIVPAWLRIAAILAVGGIVLVLLWTVVLRRQVATRTREFRESEEKYRSLVHNLNVGIARSAADGSLLEVNPAMLRMFGYDNDEKLSNFTVLELYQYPSDRDLLWGEIQDRGRVRGKEIRLRKKDGTPIWASITADAAFDDHGRIKWIDSVAEDVTEIKQAADALRASERRQAEIIESLPVATFAIDREGRVVAWNRAMEGLSGVRAEAMIGKGDQEYALPFFGCRQAVLIDLVLLPPEQAAEVLQSRYAAVHWEGPLLKAEAVTRGIKGEERVLSCWAQPVFDSAGNMAGAIESLTDITDKKRADEIRHAGEVAEASNRAKSVFLANMSHEIRTPLNAILGFSQILGADPTLNRQQREQVDTINRSGEFLLGVINDILEVSKIEAGRVVLHPADFDLRAMISDLEVLFSVRVKEKGLALHVTVEPEVPACVRGDEGKLRQIYINLLGNAAKFTAWGSISLRIDCRAGQGGVWLLTSAVEDTGQGIMAEEQGRLFGHFEQTASGIRAGGGTGLGLAICREYARMMGGDITVSSEVGRGSCFSFSVQLTAGDVQMVAKRQPRTRAIAIREGGERNRILVVDDKAENRTVLTQMLGRVGFVIEEERDGADAVKRFGDYRPHLVLMDIKMPVMDGYEATRRIRALEGGRETRIIAVSASIMDEDRRAALAAGVDGFIGKPFREADLFEVVGSVLQIKFDYAADAAEPYADGGGSTPLPEALHSLPVGMLASLRQAVISADIDSILEVIEAIGFHDQQTAESLRNMARRYEYETLLQILPQGK